MINRLFDSTESRRDTAKGLRPSEQPDVRAVITEFIAWNQAMEGIASSQEQAEAAYDEALRNRCRVFEQGGMPFSGIARFFGSRESECIYR